MSFDHEVSAFFVNMAKHLDIEVAAAFHSGFDFLSMAPIHPSYPFQIGLHILRCERQSERDAIVRMNSDVPRLVKLKLPR